LDILTIHLPINDKSPNNINKWQMEFNSEFKGLISKGKALPLQAWTDPEGSRSLRLPDLKTIGT
jgi:hypothetical protein